MIGAMSGNVHAAEHGLSKQIVRPVRMGRKLLCSTPFF